MSRLVPCWVHMPAARQRYLTQLTAHWYAADIRWNAALYTEHGCQQGVLHVMLGRATACCGRCVCRLHLAHATPTVHVIMEEAHAHRMQTCRHGSRQGPRSRLARPQHTHPPALMLVQTLHQTQIWHAWCRLPVLSICTMHPRMLQ